MNLQTFYGILIPFLGTSLGSACVFLVKNGLSDRLSRIFTGFAAGVMTAASVWGLLIPSMEQSASMGKLSFLPALIGFWIGVLFLLLLDHVIPENIALEWWNTSQKKSLLHRFGRLYRAAQKALILVKKLKAIALYSFQSKLIFLRFYFPNPKSPFFS